MFNTLAKFKGAPEIPKVNYNIRRMQKLLHVRMINYTRYISIESLKMGEFLFLEPHITEKDYWYGIKVTWCLVDPIYYKMKTRKLVKLNTRRFDIFHNTNVEIITSKEQLLKEMFNARTEVIEALTQ